MDLATNIKLSFIETGFFKLDGGAMFGVVPKQLWNRMNPSDNNNMCTWSMRCLLIETENRTILVDTGLGNKQDAKFRSHFEPHGDDDLITSLQLKGYQPEDITDVFLTHLHFDHSGGAVKYNEFEELIPTFPNATYWSNQLHYDWAYTPNPREKASFLKENFVPLVDQKVMEFIDINPNGKVDWLEGIQLECVHGHTTAMMLLHIPYQGRKVVYCADLIPSSYHLGLPYVMSYDVQPLKTMEEKKQFLHTAVEENALLVFEHDPKFACASIKYNDRNRIVIDQYFNQISDFIPTL